MVCEACIRAAAVDRAAVDAGASEEMRKVERIKHPHCDTVGCTCQHRPVDTIKIAGK